MKSPHVSIILPTHNGVRTIAKAIESIRAQTYADWELIIVNDGSTDNTREYLTRVCERDERIVVLENPSNLGIQKTLNRGLSVARGVYIARIDDDDIWIHSDKLHSQVAFLDQHPEYVLVGTNGTIVDERGQYLGTYHLPETDSDIRNRMLFKNCFLHPSVLIRRSAVEVSGRYDERPSVQHIEDYALWLRIGCIGLYANIPLVGVQLMVRRDSLTFRNRIKQAQRMRSLIRVYKNEYPHYMIARAILLVRIIGFRILRFIPLPSSLVYAIQRLYKRF
jgi:glycosyltransferase involved in cell wall biosynthesis